MIELIIGQIWPYLALIAAGIAAIVGIRQSSKSAGRQEIRQEINEAESAARKEARNVETETAGMADSDIDADLKRWVRGAKR